MDYNFNNFTSFINIHTKMKYQFLYKPVDFLSWWKYASLKGKKWSITLYRLWLWSGVQGTQGNRVHMRGSCIQSLQRVVDQYYHCPKCHLRCMEWVIFTAYRHIRVDSVTHCDIDFSWIYTASKASHCQPKHNFTMMTNNSNNFCCD